MVQRSFFFNGRLRETHYVPLSLPGTDFQDCNSHPTRQEGKFSLPRNLPSGYNYWPTHCGFRRKLYWHMMVMKKPTKPSTVMATKARVTMSHSKGDLILSNWPTGTEARMEARGPKPPPGGGFLGGEGGGRNSSEAFPGSPEAGFLLPRAIFLKKFF